MKVEKSSKKRAEGRGQTPTPTRVMPLLRISLVCLSPSEGAAWGYVTAQSFCSSNQYSLLTYTPSSSGLSGSII